MSRKRFQLMREQKAERTKQQLDVHSKKYGEYQRQHKVNAGERKYLPALDGKKKKREYAHRISEKHNIYTSEGLAESLKMPTNA